MLAHFTNKSFNDELDFAKKIKTVLSNEILKFSLNSKHKIFKMNNFSFFNFFVHNFYEIKILLIQIILTTNIIDNILKRKIH